jgi:protease I
MKVVVMVVAPERFRDEEYAEPRTVLEGRGAQIVTASTKPGECVGKLGARICAEVALSDVEPSGIDALVFVGGAGAETYFDDPVAHALVRAMLDLGKVVGAICVAPSVLAHAGVLRGRRATAYPDRAPDLAAHGAVYTAGPVEVDGQVVTANGPEAAREFGMALGDLLGLP